MRKSLTWVEKVVGPLSTLVVGFTLSNLILMVRKGQVNPSRVDVQLTSKHCAKTATEERNEKKNQDQRVKTTLYEAGRYPHLAIVEHSMCHPGLPLPHGDSQQGSPALDLFHKAKSLASRLCEPCAEAWGWGQLWKATLPVRLH